MLYPTSEFHRRDLLAGSIGLFGLRAAAAIGAPSQLARLRYSQGAMPTIRAAAAIGHDPHILVADAYIDLESALDPRMFGAVGNGEVDDTKAILAVLRKSANTGRPVLVRKVPSSPFRHQGF